MEHTLEQAGNPLGYAPIGKLLRKFALPAVISMLVNAVYNIVDQIFIGQGVGYLGNAATTVAFPVVTIILAVSTLLGAGGSAYAAIKLGEKREEEAEKTLGNLFTLLMGSGIVVMILGLIFLDPMLRLFGATDNIMEYSRQYTSILLLGAPFNMLGIGFSNMARTDGNPSLSMYSILVGAILNTILDPIYIFVFHWGVVGAAIATITSQIISAVVLMVYFLKKGTMRLKWKNLRLDRGICQAVMSLGISSGITQIASTILQIVLNNSLVFYGEQTTVGGDVALSAMGIVSKISMVLVSICVGIGIGSQPILGFNKGAGNLERIRQTYLRAISIATLVSVAGCLMCQIFPNQILMLFGNADSNFTDFAVKCLRIYMIGVFTSGFQVVSTSYFQATGQPLKASILSMLRQLLILIPMVLILPLFFGLDGILYAGPVADLSSAVVVVFCRT
ncbi:MAG: MATE family efflux transporter [Hungatella sp.]